MTGFSGVAPRAAFGPSAWSAPSADAVAALRADARFPEAMVLAATALVELFQGNRILNCLLSDRGRFVVALLALDLHFDAERGGPGLTLTRLQDVCARTGVCSPGRTAALLAVMRLFGLVVAAPAGDRRVRQLVPTERLVAMHRERWRRVFRAMQSVLPEAGQVLAQFERPDFLAGYVHRLADAFRSGFRPLDVAPVLKPVAERNAGFVILLSLLVARREQGSSPDAPVGFAVAAAARRFSVARAHVRTVLRDAEDAGLIVRAGARDERVTALPPLMEALETFFATMFLVQISCARPLPSRLEAPLPA